jgi:ABC-type phosphate/phosphonate transport system substrate-binding protein
METKKIIILLILVILLVNSNFSQSDNTLKKDVVRMGALTSMVDGVELKDAEAAFKIWTDSFIKRLKAKKIYDFDFEGKMYENIFALKKDVKDNIINYFNVSVIDYLELNKNGEFVPFLSGTNHPKNEFIHFLLIANVKNPSNSINELAKQKIYLSKSLEKSIGIYWLKGIIREVLGPKPYKTINYLSINQNENEDLLSVYFGKTDCALVSEGTFDIACELNPVIKSKIKILKKSGPLLTGVFVYKKGANKLTLKKIRDIAIDIHNDNEGKQILNLFKIQRITPIVPEDLSESEKVINTYNKYFK